MSGDAETLPIRMTWRRTWPDQPDDYAVPGLPKGTYLRIYKVEGGPQGDRWRWSVSRGRRTAGTSYEDTAREAAHAAEAAYEAAGD